MGQLTKRETEMPTWNPMRELQEMSNRMSQLFGSSSFGRNWLFDKGEEALAPTSAWAPNVNVSEANGEYRITADLPGVEKKDIHVRMQNGTLSIEGERRREKEETGERFFRVESYYGKFMRRFSLPEDVSSDKVQAKLENGRLEIRVPKVESKEAPKPREIKIA